MAGSTVKVAIVAEDKASKELKGIGGAADDAGTGFGKLGAAAAAGGAAIVALGVKSVLAFEDLGLTVGKFSSATGVSNEAASRLIEVAGDLGIGTDTLQGAVLKMEKGLGASGTGLEKFGVAAVKGKEGLTDVNATFANAVGVINGIQDPLKRAEAQAAIFGKGFSGSAELTTMSADDLKAALAGVSDAKIFTDDKVKSARDLRSSFDSVKDAGEDILLTLGSLLAPVVSKLATTFAGLIKSVGPIVDLLGDAMVGALNILGPLLEGLVTIVGGLAKGIAWLVEGVTQLDEEVMKQVESGKALAETLTDLEKRGHAMGLTTAEMVDIFHDAGNTTGALEDKIKRLESAIGGSTLSTSDAARVTADYSQRVAGATATLKPFDIAVATAERTAGVFKDTVHDAAAETQALNDQYAALIGKLDATEAWDNAQAAIDEYKWKLKDGTSTTAEQEQALRDAIRALADYTVNLKGLPTEQKTKILAELSAGNLSQAQADLEAWASKLKLSVKIGATVVGTTGAVIKNSGYAEGTDSAAPGWHWTGEEGPELVNFGKGGGKVIPNHKLGGGGSTNVTMNFHAPMSAAEITRLARKYQRRNG